MTARFNSNVLARLNRELGANFDLNNFVHVAEWNPRASRMEMYLESSGNQQVRIPAVGLNVGLMRGERIHTENSYKYTPGRINELLSAAGFAVAFTGRNSGWGRLALVAGSLAVMAGVYATIVPHEEEYLRSQFGETFDSSRAANE